MRLDGVVGVLTGATGGIGRALALCLAQSGMKLILAARNPDRLTALADELPPGSVAGICAGDLSEPGAQCAVARLARSDGAGTLINLCGGNQFALLDGQTNDDARALITTNLIAPIQLTQALLPHLRSRSEAMIVNVGSAFGAIGFPGYSLYCASKFGLRGFSEALGRELSDTAVRVIYVAPRATRTDMNSAAACALNAALGNAEDSPRQVARHIVRSMQRSRPRTGIGWPERGVAALNQLLPSLVDRAIARQLPLVRRFASKPIQEDPIS